MNNACTESDGMLCTKLGYDYLNCSKLSSLPVVQKMSTKKEHKSRVEIKQCHNNKKHTKTNYNLHQVTKILAQKYLHGLHLHCSLSD
jgi:hypothetical protein